MAVIADQVVKADEVLDESGTDDAATESGKGAATGASDTTSATRSHRISIIVAALIVVVVALGVLVGLKTDELMDQRAASARDTQILDVTRTVVAGLVNLDYNRSEADLNRIKSVATGAFKDQFDQVAASFSQVLDQGQVQSTGTVKEAGIVSANDDAATVLAAVSSVVRNSEAPDGQQRVYRMRVQLAHQGDQWRVSNVEFVS